MTFLNVITILNFLYIISYLFKSYFFNVIKNYYLVIFMLKKYFQLPTTYKKPHSWNLDPPLTRNISSPIMPRKSSLGRAHMECRITKRNKGVRRR